METTTLPTATELVAGYSTGEWSPVEATDRALRRIEQYDGALNAFCHLDVEATTAAAAESEQRWRQGNPIGLLDGIPVSIKDMFLTAGWPTLRGSRCIDPAQPWDTDAPVTARLREHGAVLIGKTTTPELGWKGVTDSPLTGITRNPWNTDLTAGGSSGGSAAAVAAGMGALSVGTDGGGSVRIPASFCGIAGFKPTYGRIPLYPSSPFGSLAHAGPMATSVDDLALLLDVLALRDFRDPNALPQLVGSYREAVRRPVQGLVAAYSPTLGYAEVDGEVAMIVRGAVEALADAGLRVELADPGFADPADAFDVLWCAGAAQWLDHFPPGSAERIDPGLRAVWERGATFTAADYLTAMDRRTALGVHMGQFHESYDILLTPTMPIAAFEAGHDVPPGSTASGVPAWPSWTPFTYPFNLTQQPAATVPAGLTADGRPVGLQIVGPRHSDDLVLAVARTAEAVLPAWQAPDLSVAVPPKERR
ncbi:amidase [Actinocatenispora rupis]|uniref:Amidase n=1 Tax=Actinocatenispora rupis TaxID=519421 RepID=A0A8J3J9U0_9ACTN|nr:amidase [Actinocatenispora rupis]GID12073.1 amidase [Actinocatenispora rupis]